MFNLRLLFVATVLLLPWNLLFAQNADEELQHILEMLDQGESAEHLFINLTDINFATGTATLASSAKTYLDKVVKLLKLAPNMELMIKGHADNTGSTAVNEKLATNRAVAVRFYLFEQGIEASRLKSLGYGSSMPIADNSTAEGRAKNRRVELEILKKAEAKTVQDIIVLRDGQKNGAIVTTYDSQKINYRQFSDDDEQNILTELVEKIVFADGRVVRFDPPVVKQTLPAPRPIIYRAGFRPFAESEAFHKGQFFIGAGIGIKSNIGIGYQDNNLKLLPVWMVLELPVGHNLGVSLSASAMQWSPKTDTDAALAYYSIAPRLAYHFNLGNKIDLYGGVAVTGRIVSLEIKDTESQFSNSNHKIDASFFGGIRYYLSSSFGFCCEIGGDSITCAKIGLALRFGQ